MSIVRRVTAISLALLLVIGSTLARPAPDAGAPRAADGAAIEPVPAPARPPAPPGPNAVVGAGGVGFNGPNQKMQLEVLKLMLDVGDDEWKLLVPKIEKVLASKQNTNTGAGMNWTTSNKAGPQFKPSTSKPDTAPGRALQAVRDAVADQATSKEELAKRMSAVRDARKKARADYEAAQHELIDTATLRQQAILMTLGVIE
jgi:hypothetical protein